MGWRALVHGVKAEAPAWASTVPQLPRLVHHALADAGKQRTEQKQRMDDLAAGQRMQGRMLALIGLIAATLLGLELYRLFG